MYILIPSYLSHFLFSSKPVLLVLSSIKKEVYCTAVYLNEAINYHL